MPICVRWVIALTMLVIAIDVTANESTQLLIRDAESGLGVDAQIELVLLLAPVAPTATALDTIIEDGHARGTAWRLSGMRPRLPLRGRHAARIVADGYAPLRTIIEPGAAARSWTLWLRPLPTVAHTSEKEPGHLYGHVVDSMHLRAIAGARLHLASGAAVGKSDVHGRFMLPVAFQNRSDRVLQPDRLVVAAPDGRRIELPVALIANANLHLIVDLDASHGDEPGHRHLALGRDGVQHEPDRLEPGQRLRLSDPALMADEPPASIRVGYGNAGCSSTCCTGNCTHVCVFDTETYVRRGLNKEWIASWHTQSLRAGSIAYRSYGAWHAFNPVAGRPFDLCSSACCQVNSPGTSTSTDLAIARTAGLMLVRNGNVFRSEYSAENNCLLGTLSCANSDLSCGNGHAGSPAANWPCLHDPVGLDRDCFGHGRGMSQWGTQRWSQAPHLRTWRWQIDHYYNAHGTGAGLRTATIGRVLVLDTVQPRRRTVAAGASLFIDYEARNLAASAHEHVLLGASLRRSPDPFVDDPDNDLKVTLPPGNAARVRPFAVPPALPPGRYDLYASLYLDVDEDKAITSADLAQALLVNSAAVRIVAPHDLIFYNGLQSDSP